jgi:hypothetical protein
VLKNSLAALLVTATVGASAAPPTDTEKLVALTRLYGVVRWFHPADSAQEIDWNRFAIHAAKRIRVARSVDDLDKILETLFAPVAVGLTIGAELPEPTSREAPAGARLVAWRHLGLGTGSMARGTGRTRTYTSARTNRPAEINPLSSQMPCEVPLPAGGQVDVDLGSGLRARVPLVLTDAEATVDARQQRLLDALKTELGALPDTLEATDRDVRTADVIVAWSVFRHFYPYWAEVGVDWDTRLPSLLEAASAAGSREAHRDVLRRLVAGVRDGHGSVRDPRDGRKQASLPITARWLAGRLVVTASAVPERVRTGDVITAIDGQPTGMWFSEQEALTSGSSQWRADRVVVALTRGPEGTRATLELERPSATLKVELTRTLREPVREVRPEQIAQVRPGVWYVDLERTDWSTLQPHLPDLAGAQAVIFDVRGYPSDAGMRVLPYLLKAPDRDRWMHIPCIVEPFGRVATWQSRGWNLAPASPHLAGQVAFLTDARAISYAESVMGYVEALGLGTIVGSATAGTNGNVNAFSVPSGMTITFTGMRVTRHDGSPFHLLGVQPDVPVEPTAAGIRGGRDEVLERALAAARPTALISSGSRPAPPATPGPARARRRSPGQSPRRAAPPRGAGR